MNETGPPQAGTGGRLEWTSLGGSNGAQLGGNGHVFSHVARGADGREARTTVLVDLGRYRPPPAGSGVDALVPDARRWLEGPDKAAAVFLTHGHDDHIGGIPAYIRLGRKLPPIYAAPYTVRLLQDTLVRDGIPRRDWPEVIELKPGQEVRLGDITVEPVPVSHSVPDTLAFRIKTPDAAVIHSGDVKADQGLHFGPATDFKRLREMGREGVDALLVDCTSAGREGLTPSEAGVAGAFTRIARDNPGRRVVAAVAGSHVERIASVARAAAASDRTLVVHSAFMRQMVHGLKEAGYDIHDAAGPGFRMVDGNSAAAKVLPPERTIAVTWGIYGEETGGLARAVRGEHHSLALQPDDLVVVSGSRAAGRLEQVLDQVEARGIAVITKDDAPDLHACGHGQAEDMRQLWGAIRPRTMIPIHGDAKRLEAFRDMARHSGIETPARPPMNNETISFERDKPLKAVSEIPRQWLGVIETRDEAGTLHSVRTIPVADPGRATAPPRARQASNQTGRASRAQAQAPAKALTFVSGEHAR